MSISMRDSANFKRLLKNAKVGMLSFLKVIADFAIAVTEFILLVAVITTAVFYGGFVINFLLR